MNKFIKTLNEFIRLLISSLCVTMGFKFFHMYTWQDAIALSLCAASIGFILGEWRNN